MLHTSPYASFLPFIEELAHLSGNIIRGYWNRGDYTVETKSDASPVTQADRETEACLRDTIKATYPDHGIMAEEFGNENETAEYVWVLDPIDGTKSFITRVPLFGTLIGLLHQGRPVVGAIHQPITQELCIGSAAGTQLNGHTVQLRPCEQLEHAVLLTSSFEYLLDNDKTRGWEQLVRATQFSRTWGDCYGYLLLVTGRADIMVDPILNPWDILPIVPIIEGAGGKITAWDGSPLTQGHSAVAAHPAIHSQVIENLSII